MSERRNAHRRVWHRAKRRRTCAETTSESRRRQSEAWYGATVAHATEKHHIDRLFNYAYLKMKSESHEKLLFCTLHSLFTRYSNNFQVTSCCTLQLFIKKTHTFEIFVKNVKKIVSTMICQNEFIVSVFYAVKSLW